MFLGYHNGILLCLSCYLHLSGGKKMAFKRMEGFVGSIPQKFADNRIPKCPMCGTDNPHWSIDERMGKMFTLNPEDNAHKYLFKCEQCGCILRVPVTDVMGTGRSVLSWQGLAKKVHGKETKSIYVAIENVGNAQSNQEYKEKEMTLEEINALAQQLNK